MRRFRGFAVSVSVTIAFITGLLGVLPAVAQDDQEKSAWVPTRTIDGQPDIQGYWSNSDIPSSVFISLEPSGEREGVVYGGELPKGSILVEPQDGRIPFQPWAAAKKQWLSDTYTDPQDRSHIDPNSRCLPAGVPRINYVTPYNEYRILQKPGYVVIMAEWNHIARVIPVDGRPHVDSNVRLWMGDSRGRWEGNTLIVETTNFNDKTWFDIVGTFHSDALRVVERYTIVDADSITYDATIEDPNVYTRPWTLAFGFTRILSTSPEAGELYEYACHEGNRATEFILRR